MKAIRGAITVRENTVSEVEIATVELIEKIIEENKLSKDEIINITFTATRDIDCAYPAKFARNVGFDDIPLICMQEMYVVGSLEKCIRIMMLVEREVRYEVNHVYLKGATVLRPDLAQ